MPKVPYSGRPLMLAVMFLLSMDAALKACVNDGTAAPCRCMMKMLVAHGVDPVVASIIQQQNSSYTSSVLLPQSSANTFLGSDLPVPGATQPVQVVGTDSSDSFFISDNITINVGDSVQWTWAPGATGHTVTSVSTNTIDPFNSGFLFGAGQTFSHTFTHAGSFVYYCALHGQDHGDGTAAGQVGVVNVVSTPEPSFLALVTACSTGLLLRRRK